MSIHAIEIIEIGEVLPHPNPEVTRMELTKVWGWQCCIGKGQFKSGDKAVYVPPDYLVPLSHPEFTFLKKEEGKTQERIRVRRFKGTLSQGLIIAVPKELLHLPIGTNVIDQLGIERYEPPIPMSTYGMFVSAPSGVYAPKFDVESWQRYRHLFIPGEEVIISEKLHGSNSRFTYARNKEGRYEQFCGSRTNWMKEDDRNIWWQAYRQNPEIGKWCNTHSEKVLYGEVFGNVQSLRYSAKQNEVFFAAFAALNGNEWMSYDEFSLRLTTSDGSEVKRAPLLYRGPLSEEKLLELADGDSSWPGANHMREGVVVTPCVERTCDEIGRVCLKVVSNRYLESGK